MEKSNSPAFQFYAQDFLTGVMYLTNEEIGIYIKMLSKQWTDGKIPKKRLGFLVGVDWENLPDELKSKFVDLGEFVINERLEKEREKRTNFIKKQSENGKKGGRPDLKNELTALNGEMIPRECSDEDHFLYVFKKISDGSYKIGETKDLFKRRLTIKVPTSDLRIIHFVKINPDENLEIEKSIKEKFVKNQISGDWFNFSASELSDLIKEMDRLKNPNKNQKKPLEDEVEDEIEEEIEIENNFLEKSEKPFLKENHIIDHLNEISDRHFKKTENNRKHIRARLNESWTIDQLKKIIEIKTLEWKGNPEMEKHLNPETLFRPKHIEKYWNQVLDAEKNPITYQKHFSHGNNKTNGKPTIEAFDPLDALDKFL